MNETDSNADTCCLGANFCVLQFTQRTADVYSYDSAYEPLENVPIVTAATAWDHPDTGETWLLIMNEGLFYGSKLGHSLLNPNQLRHHGVIYQDNPFDSAPLSITIPGLLKVPLQSQGTKIRFSSRVPTISELEFIPESRRIELTNLAHWNPSTVHLASVESHMKGDIGFIEPEVE